MAFSIASRFSAGSFSSAVSTEARPSSGSAPTDARSSPYWAKTSAKYVCTACPNRIGSDTFIIVALRCTENSTPASLAAATCSARNAVRAALRITAASTISPACTGNSGLRTVTVPSAATCSIRTSVGAARVTETSECRKSPSSIVVTRDAESADHSPIECGCFFAKFFTDAGARRSELPSRSTGFTALPFTESYAARAAFSASVRGSSG